MFNEFKVVFLSIIFEAFPFLLVGSIVASYIELFISEDSIKKILPKNPFIQIVSAAFLGLIFPICECTIIPIARRLIQKSVPVSTALVFMLATPLINPIPILATYYAFGRTTDVMIHGLVLGFIIAMSVGLLHLHHKKEDVQMDGEEKQGGDGHGHTCCHCHLSHDEMKSKNLWEKIRVYNYANLLPVMGGFFREAPLYGRI